jgi:hypothetical protein
VKGTPGAPDLSGRFTDPNLPAGFAPFNIQNLGGTMYVAYAQQDAAKHDEMAGAGPRLRRRFDLQGNLITRLVSRGTLDAPWGWRSRRSRSARSPARSWSATSATAESAPSTRRLAQPSGSLPRSTERRSRSTASGRSRRATAAPAAPRAAAS